MHLPDAIPLPVQMMGSKGEFQEARTKPITIFTFIQILIISPLG
jgi:hypothetical protein